MTSKTFGKFFISPSPRCRRMPAEYHPGVRSFQFRDFFPEKERSGSYYGHFPSDFLVMMQKGRVEFRRELGRSVAEAGSALLIKWGWGGLDFFAPADADLAEATILEFGERALAPILRRYPRGEALAVQPVEFPLEGVTIPDLWPRLERFIADRRPKQPSPEDQLEFLVLNEFEKVSGILRAVFYKPRWNMMRLLERHVLFPNAVRRIAPEYFGGPREMYRDAQLFLGETPEKWLKRRRMQLAKIWLRFGHPVKEVAKALGYSEEWGLRSDFAGFWKCTCESVQKAAPLDHLSIGELLALIRPCWWLAPRPLNPILGPYTCTEEAEDYTYVSRRRKRERADLKVASQQMDHQPAAAIAGAGMPLRTSTLKKSRSKTKESKSMTWRRCSHEDRAAEKLRDLAPEFFAMESTGAELLVPIYQP